jgi:hypothetical protein
MSNTAIFKVLSVIFISIVAVLLIASGGILSIFACVGGNTILSDDPHGTTLHALPVDIQPNTTDILRSFGVSFLVILVDLSSLYIYVFSALFWLSVVCWIFWEELIKISKWILAIKVDFTKRTITFPPISED